MVSFNIAHMKRIYQFIKGQSVLHTDSKCKYILHAVNRSQDPLLICGPIISPIYAALSLQEINKYTLQPATEHNIKV